MNENKTGDLPVGRKNFECSIRTQPPGKVRRQTKRKMRLRKLKLDSRFAVDPAWLDALHYEFFSTPESRQHQQEPPPQSGGAQAAGLLATPKAFSESRTLSICESMAIPLCKDELSGTKDGTNVVFLHTTVDDGDHFQQILAWTLKSRWQQQNEQLREITENFRSEK